MTKTRTLGKYQILEEIGRGGFSVVYKALDTSLDNRPVALKVLHPHLLVDPTFVQRFQQEAGAAANLRHPNIVVVHEVGEIEGTYYIAMEYLPGTPLDELIKREGPLGPPRAVKIIQPIASALDYAHQQGFIHRDVKSGNIIVDEDDHATLTDFGLVRAAEGTALTSTGKVLGTPEYMSPEQADPKKARDLDWRTDLYSLGIVAYEMLTSHVPFKGDTPTATHYMHVHEKPPKPTVMNPNLPKGMEAPILKALAKRRSDRYQTGEDFAQALAKSIGPGKPSNRWKWLSVAGASAAGLMLAVIVCAAMSFTWPPGGSPAQTPTSASTMTIVLVPTETYTPTASPTDTATPTMTPTPMPTSTPTITPSPARSPTPTSPATAQSTAAAPTPALTAVSTQVSECPEDIACIDVRNPLDYSLTFSLRGTELAEEVQVGPYASEILRVAPGWYQFRASTITRLCSMRPNPISRRKAGGLDVSCSLGEIALEGELFAQGGQERQMGFAVTCGWWEDNTCFEPRLELMEYPQ